MSDTAVAPPVNQFKSPFLGSLEASHLTFPLSCGAEGCRPGSQTVTSNTRDQFDDGASNLVKLGEHRIVATARPGWRGAAHFGSGTAKEVGTAPEIFHNWKYAGEPTGGRATSNQPPGFGSGSPKRETLSCLGIALAVCAMTLYLGCQHKGPGEHVRAAASGRVNPPSRTMMFEARGRDFKWHFFSSGPDGKLHTKDDSEIGSDLTVPPRTRLILDLTSDDYIYTLTSPTGEKQVAVPGMVHQIAFDACESGVYEFRTDPMCGLRYFHDDVQGTLSVDAIPLQVQVRQMAPGD